MTQVTKRTPGRDEIASRGPVMHLTSILNCAKSRPSSLCSAGFGPLAHGCDCTEREQVQENMDRSSIATDGVAVAPSQTEKGRHMAAGANTIRRKVWQSLSSIKTGVILLIIVVILSAVGTLVLQRPVTEPDEMQRAYSPQMLSLLDKLGLTDVFHAWWFVALLILVSISIIAASIDRFPNAWRYFARPYKFPAKPFRRALPTQAQIPIPDEETGLVAAERSLHSMGFKPERVVGIDRLSIFTERNRISEMALYIVHASLLLIFLGGIVDALWGWRGYISLTHGQQTSVIGLRDGKKKDLSFAI